MKRTLLTFIITLFLAVPAYAYNKTPGDGVTVQPARATWNTGYFQEALIRRGLEELGYKVRRPKDLQNPIFYQTVALGDVDYWTNGWFPNHNNQLPKNFYKTADLYGYVVRAGGLQGYLVSKKHAEKYNIKSLDDFKRPEVKKVFDANGDGKADLIACPPGWGCEKVISHHMKVYKMKNHINPIQAAYSASIAEGMARFNAGEPVFFYTWAPNWTIFKMKPGEDVVWINVPEIIPLGAQAMGRDRMTVSGVKGAVSDPVKLGFVVSDIQIVGNKKFVENNPAVKKFFADFSLPLSDINEQNTKMQDGEDSQRDIEKHVDQWIASHQSTWNKWLEEARSAAN